MFKIEDFKNYFGKHNDFAKPSKFEVRIGLPANGADWALASFVQDLRFQCEATELPGYNINTVDNRIYGVPNPVASTASFGDITLTFICAGDMIEKRYFDYWMNRVIPINDYNPEYKETYAADIEIIQYSEIVSNQRQPITRENQEVYSMKLFQAFPVAMAPIGLSWADDSISRLAVTFKFEYWAAQGGNIRGASDVIPNIDARYDGSSSQVPRISRLSPSSVKNSLNIFERVKRLF